MWEKIQQWDRELFVYLNNLGIERYDAFWIFVTDPRHWIPLYLLFFLFFFLAFHWKKASFSSLFLLACVFSTWSFTNLVKGIALRLRPNNTPELTDLIRILQEPTNYSFFSGHSSTSFAATTFVVLILSQKTRWIYLAYIWPIVFVTSRIYVGVHYPGDIIVGMIVGIILANLFYFLYVRSGRRFI
ncbi:phosphatase PAP2 family protein [Pontixanthobacter gangjinensis]|uniref:Phosphatase PAP2 family protein n=1 Tax=Christiangramia aestuarii TaxID=1028746 RepID=A0A7M3SY82_9FLAO|nr:phosphatase PAP2 family protein [Christiangramia aestuarii]MUP41563.1 phosphatase PAP2 family protein [Christiangramia aestuarii]